MYVCFSYVLNKVLLLPTKLKRNEKNLVLFLTLLSSNSPHLNSRAKIKQVFNSLTTLGLIASIKKFKKNIRENNYRNKHYTFASN